MAANGELIDVQHNPKLNIASFGEDAEGELYILAFDGRIHELVPQASTRSARIDARPLNHRSRPIASSACAELSPEVLGIFEAHRDADHAGGDPLRASWASSWPRWLVVAGWLSVVWTSPRLGANGIDDAGSG